MNNTQKHFDEIDITKGIAILSVIFSHSMILYPKNIHDLPWCHNIANIISTYFLVSFFMVSGFLFSGRKQSFKEVFIGKSKRLLMPYFCFSILNLFMKLIMPSLVNKQIESIPSYLAKLFLFGGEIWFLYTLFIIMIVWSLIITRIKKEMIPIGIVVLIIIDCIIKRDAVYDIMLYTYFIHYSIFFLTGYYLRMNDIWYKYIQKKTTFLIFMLLFIIVTIYINELYMYMPTKLFCKFIGVFFIWSFSYQILKHTFIIKKSLSWCGKESLALYWLNGYCLVISRTIVISLLQINNSVQIATTIFILTLLLEIPIIMATKKLPYMKYIIGV